MAALLFLGLPSLDSIGTLLSFILGLGCEFFRISIIFFFLQICIALSVIEVLVSEQCGNTKNVLFVCCCYFVGKIREVGML